MSAARSRPRRGLALIAGLAAILTAVAAPQAASASPAGGVASTLRTVVEPFACQAPRSTKVASCFGELLAKKHSDGAIGPMTTTAPSGYGPADIQSAYKLTGLKSGGKTVAIVDAYNDPNAAKDLAVYRAHYGLPACTTANGCFKQVNQNGDLAAALDRLRLGTRDQPRPGHGVGGLPGLPHPARRGQHARTTPTSTRPRTPQPPRRRGGRLEQLRRCRGEHPDSRRRALQPPRRRDHRELGRQRLRRLVPGGLEVRHRGRRHVAEQGEQRARLDRDGLERRRFGLLGLRGRSRPGRPTPAARSAPSPTCRPWPTRTPASPCTTPPTAAAPRSFCDQLIALGIVQGADGYVQVGGTSASSPIIASVYALGGHTSASWTYAHAVRAQRRDLGQQRQLQRFVPVHRRRPGYDGPTGLGTPNGTGAF